MGKSNFLKEWGASTACDLNSQICARVCVCVCKRRRGTSVEKLLQLPLCIFLHLDLIQF